MTAPGAPASPASRVPLASTSTKAWPAKLTPDVRRQIFWHESTTGAKARRDRPAEVRRNLARFMAYLATGTESGAGGPPSRGRRRVQPTLTHPPLVHGGQ